MPKNKEEQSAYQPSILDWQENQDPEKKEAYYSFPEGTPMWRDGHKGMVTAVTSFVAKRVEGKIAGYAAFELVQNVKVFYQRGWEPKSYFYLKTGEKMGISTSSKDFKPTKFK